ncbi:unnamed protein product [Peronospora destructor]|uniref:Endoplasmic reticulum transmembrane protein n=1 Tax=Peronospora destructor TaxID=86335 RepID=A0AAV0VAW2_9STRA|nr:unnamed protein product [Peronospora destructor]
MARYLQLHGEGTGVLRMFLATHLIAKQLNNPDVKKLLQEKPKHVMTMRELRQMATLLGELRVSDPSTPSLVSLLRQGNGIQVRAVAAQEGEEEEEQKMKEKKAQYLAKRREKLQRLDEEMQYSNIVRNFKTSSVTKELANYQTNARQHFSIGANMVMARITAFVAVFFVARNLTDNETTRLVAGLGGAIVMMVIEMVLFITRAAKIESFEEKLRKLENIF